MINLAFLLIFTVPSFCSDSSPCTERIKQARYVLRTLEALEMLVGEFLSFERASCSGLYAKLS